MNSYFFNYSGSIEASCIQDGSITLFWEFALLISYEKGLLKGGWIEYKRRHFFKTTLRRAVDYYESNNDIAEKCVGAVAAVL
jgi:hypothetical protein